MKKKIQTVLIILQKTINIYIVLLVSLKQYDANIFRLGLYISNLYLYKNYMPPKIYLYYSSISAQINIYK